MNTEDILNGLGLILGLMIIVFIAIAGWQDYKLINSVSFRLTIGGSVLFCFVSITNLLKERIGPGPCVYMAWFRIFTRLVVSFLIFILAFNFHFTFILGNKYRKSMELYYWIISTSSSMLITFLIFLFDGFGKTNKDEICFLKNLFDYQGIIIYLFLFTVPFVIIAAYFIYLIVVSLRTLKEKLKELDKLKQIVQKKDSVKIQKIQTKLKFVIFRV